MSVRDLVVSAYHFCGMMLHKQPREMKSWLKLGEAGYRAVLLEMSSVVVRLLTLPYRPRLGLAQSLCEGVRGQEREEGQGVQPLLWNLLVVRRLRMASGLPNALHE
jgi:hypothetical protein